MNRCQACSAETDMVLCWDHTRALNDICEQVFDMVTELQTQVAKQNVGEKQPGGGGSNESPILFEERASEAADLLAETVGQWSKLENHRGVSGKLAHALLNAHWMWKNSVTLAQDEHAGDCLEEMTYMLQHCYRVIDIQSRKISLGVCECGKGVFAWPTWTRVACECGRSYDVASSREALQEMGREQLVTIAQARYLGEFDGKSIKAGTVRQWVNRRKIEVKGKNPEGVNLFRFGDLLDLLKGGKTPGG